MIFSQNKKTNKPNADYSALFLAGMSILIGVVFIISIVKSLF